MAAFNWIELESTCPVCSEATIIRAQSHVAASFESDEQGRFCQRTYKLGDKMRWWPRGNNDYDKWMIGGKKEIEDPDSVRECCYATCVAHADRLYVVLAIADLVVRGVLEIGPEEKWPASYPK
jgi:hypothetical protein